MGAHVHRGPDIERLMYVSNSRVKTLHDAQIELMNRLKVPVLDLYNYTYESAWYTKENDAIHFMDFIHTQILDELYPAIALKQTISKKYLITTSVCCVIKDSRLCLIHILNPCKW